MTDGDRMLDTLLTGAIPGPFHHRQHLEVTVAAIRRYGPAEAELILRGAISSAARRVGLTEKYHDTITRFWCRLVGHVLESAGPDAALDDLLGVAPLLADKTVISRHWSPEAIGTPAARQGWLAPDREPLPC